MAIKITNKTDNSLNAATTPIGATVIAHSAIPYELIVAIALLKKNGQRLIEYCPIASIDRKR